MRRMCLNGNSLFVSVLFSISLFFSCTPWDYCSHGNGCHGVSAMVIDTTGPSCSVPLPKPSVSLPPCNGDFSSLTLKDAQLLAPRYAPEVRFHPLERYFLQDIDVWWNASELFLPDFRVPEESAYRSMFKDKTAEILLSPRSFVSVLNSSKISSNEHLANLLAGASFDARNRSMAKVYYTVHDYQYNSNYWIYNFNHFYSWNGCSNQAAAISMNGTAELTNYIMCPVGVHEADMERVSVLVCKGDKEAKRIAYSQHEWTEERDCTLPSNDPQGCPRNPETGNFVTHAGLESHANYPTSSPLDVYEFVSGTIKGAPVSLNNLGGVFIADRTLFGGKRWEPEPDGSNLIYIPPPAEIQEEPLPEFQWAIWAGNWGAPLKMPRISLWCFDGPDQTSLSPCPTNTTTVKAILLAAKLLGVVGLIDNQEGNPHSKLSGFSPDHTTHWSNSAAADLQYVYTMEDTFNIDDILLGGPYYSKAATNKSTVQYPSIPGIMTRAFSYLWVANDSAPIQSSYPNNTLVCPEDIQLQESIPTDDFFSTSISTVSTYVIGVFVGDVGFSLTLVLLLSLPMLLDKSAHVHRMAAKGIKSFDFGWRTRRAAKWGSDGLRRLFRKNTHNFLEQNAQTSLLNNGATGNGYPMSILEENLDDYPGKSENCSDKNRNLNLSETTCCVHKSSVSSLQEDTILPRAHTTGNFFDDSIEQPLMENAHVSEERAFYDDRQASSGTSTPTESLQPDVNVIQVDFQVDEAPKDNNFTRRMIWIILATGLFMSGMVLLIIGMASLFGNSLLSVAFEQLDLESTGSTVRFILLAGIILVAIVDAAVLFLYLVVEPEQWGFGKFKIQNPLGGRQIILRRTFEIYVVNIGLMGFVVCITCVIFALGFTVTMMQLLVRIICKDVLSVNVLGTSMKDVCLTIPAFSSEQICGWEVLEICSEITDMKVRLLMIGSALWIWCHLIWLIIIHAALEQHKQHLVVLNKRKYLRDRSRRNVVPQILRSQQV